LGNPLDPHHMSADERLAAVARLLATGFLRLHQARKRAAAAPERSPFELDFSAPESGGPKPSPAAREDR
jgi:hypothetical protein